MRSCRLDGLLHSEPFVLFAQTAVLLLQRLASVVALCDLCVLVLGCPTMELVRVHAQVDRHLRDSPLTPVAHHP